MKFCTGSRLIFIGALEKFQGIFEWLDFLCYLDSTDSKFVKYAQLVAKFEHLPFFLLGLTRLLIH